MKTPSSPNEPLTDDQPPSPDGFHGRVAIVTGGSRGIGREAALALAERGAHVVITGRDETRLREAESAHNRLAGVRCDLADDAHIDRVVTVTAERWGRIDVLVNNAGVFDGNGRVLPHRRKIGGAWAPPSRRLEPGRSIRTALRRALRGEAQLVVPIDGIESVYSDPRLQIVRYPSGQQVCFVTALFACRHVKRTLYGSDERGDGSRPTTCRRTRTRGSPMRPVAVQKW